MRIAIVEDESKSAELLISYIRRYEEEKSIRFEVLQYTDGSSFITDYKASIDIVLMDIEMPHLDGMSAARMLREMDEEVCLIFITNMAQYAIKGYEVRAIDYIVKPVRYFPFSRMLDKAVYLREREAKKEYTIAVKGGVRRLNTSDIMYIEVRNHTLFYFLQDGQIISGRGTITEEKERLQKKDFAQPSKSFLVNMAKIEAIRKNSVVIAQNEIPVSRTHKVAFMQVLADYMGNQK